MPSVVFKELAADGAVCASQVAGLPAKIPLAETPRDTFDEMRGSEEGQQSGTNWGALHLLLHDSLYVRKQWLATAIMSLFAS
jgi:hypothetical protein